MPYEFKNVYYVCINKGYSKILNEIKDKSIIINDDITRIIEKNQII